MWLLFVGHDVEDEVVGDLHTIVTDTREIADCAIDIVFDNTFGGLSIGVLHRSIGAEYSRRYTAGDFQRTTRFGTVADHT